MYCTEIKVRRMLNLDNKRKIRNYGMANNEHRENRVQEESSTKPQTKKIKNCLKSHINNFGKGIKTNVTNLFKPLKNNIVKHTNYTSLSNRPLPLLPSPYHCSKTKTYRRQMISNDNDKALDTKDISSESIYAECLDNNTSSEPIYVNHPFDNELPEPIYVNHQFDSKLPEITYADLIFDNTPSESIYDELPVANKLPKLTYIDFQNHMSSKQGIEKTLENRYMISFRNY